MPYHIRPHQRPREAEKRGPWNKVDHTVHTFSGQRSQLNIQAAHDGKLDGSSNVIQLSGILHVLWLTNTTDCMRIIIINLDYILFL